MAEGPAIGRGLYNGPRELHLAEESANGRGANLDCASNSRFGLEYEMSTSICISSSDLDLNVNCRFRFASQVLISFAVATDCFCPIWSVEDGRSGLWLDGSG
ncbi:hypothetical protein Nepgr_003962 [Nepenthes gracilis]|uniref:Uncharacterized protein n=1 Tax=Nepenthes gracilis TaxID=150966 RepID=A0AAD3S0G4_NEPGR|nr:hypothetical protein Nepgr_003962 [Nepenthes gracilis]